MKFVLVHGAAHNGAHFDTVAALLRADGHEAWCPTTAGNCEGDDPSKITLEDAIASIVDYFGAEGIEDADLVIFLGANPWMAHGFRNARKELRTLSKDPDRHVIVIAVPTGDDMAIDGRAGIDG